MANKENKGSRIEGARKKGAEAARAKKHRDSNPYERPNMHTAWSEGYDSEVGTLDGGDSEGSVEAA